MRIAVVSPFVDRSHGTERALAELLERLAGDFGCEIHLYAQRAEEIRLTYPGAARPASSGAIFWHKVPGIPGPHLAQFLAWMFFQGFLRRWHKISSGPSCDLLLSPGINCMHPDIVIVHVLFHRLRELAREESQEPEAHVSIARRIHRKLYYGLLSTLERRIYANPDVALAAVSQRTADLLNSYFQRGDVTVVPNGVDTKQFSPAARLARRAEARLRRNLQEEDFVLLLIGNDWRNKGLSTALEALAALSGLPIKLLVAGSDAPDSFRARALQLGVHDRCRWEPFHPDVIELYAAADAYVSPSREDSFGLPVAEAMACGMPSITSVCAGVAERIHDGVDGFVLRDPRDAQTLARLLERLQSQPELRRSMGEAAARTMAEWGWDRNAATIWELLKKAKEKKEAGR